jgi:DNA-binding NarL/FixJ family response regulator
MKPISLLLVDDHPVVRQGYKSYLAKALPIEVIEAGNGREAYSAFVRFAPEVVVLDLRLPDMSGLEVLRRIRQRDPSAKVIVFTIFDNPLLLKRALEGGALGYLSKGASPKLLLQALKAVLRGERFIDPQLAEAKSPHAKLECLTRREFEVFQLLAQGKSVAEIAKVLSISPKTVGVHQTRILHKLHLPNTACLVLLAFSAGLLQPQQI